MAEHTEKQDERPAKDFSEIGVTGLKRFGGTVHEEFLRELQGPRGMNIYKEMSTNDAVIGGVLFAFEYLARQVTWRVAPASEDEKDKELAEFVWGALNDMSFSWTETIAEIFSMLSFGWSWFEIIFKRRMGSNPDPSKNSKFDDNRIGWRKWSIRSQDSLFRWVFDEDGGIQAMVQVAAPDFAVRTIPIGKSLLFRTSIHKNNPEGFSILRRAYRSWFFKKRIEEIEGIGIERDLAGLPQVIPPENYDLFNPNDPSAVTMLNRAERLVRNIRRDEQEGIVLPHGWEIKLLSTGGRRQFDTNAIIGRYDSRITMSVLADFILLGHEKVGSFALADSKTHLFAVALGSFLDSITDIINAHAIPQLLRFNGEDVQFQPLLVHGDVETADLIAVGDFVTKLTQAGIDLTDDEMVRHLRDLGKFPARTDEAEEGRRIEEEGALDEMVTVMEEMRAKIAGLEQRQNGNQPPPPGGTPPEGGTPPAGGPGPEAGE